MSRCSSAMRHGLRVATLRAEHSGRRYLPLPEEVAALQEMAADVARFAPADRYMWEMQKIPRLGERLEAIVFRRQFEERVGQLERRLAALAAAGDELLRSAGFRQLLELTLALGNFVNRGARGDARAFRLRSLAALKDTRSSTDRRVSLLHHLAAVVDHDAALAPARHLAAELPSLAAAADLDPAALAGELAALETGLGRLQSELAWHAANRAKPPKGDRFVKVVDTFVKSALPQLAALRGTLAAGQERLAECAFRFEAVPHSATSRPGPPELFGAVAQVLQQLETARADNARRAAKETAAQQPVAGARRRSVAAAAAGAPPAPAARSHARPVVSEACELDDLIGALKRGEFAPRSPRGRPSGRRRGGRR